MTSPTLTSRLKPALPRRLQLVMRDGAVIEGDAHVGEDQALVLFLNSRRGGWMNLTNARRAKDGGDPAHMILQTDHVVMASAADHGMQVAAAASPGVVERGVEISLVGGRMLRGFLHAAMQQRLSDVIAASGRFLGLANVTSHPDGRAFGDIALHSGAIAFARDLRTGPADEHDTSTEGHR